VDAPVLWYVHDGKTSSLPLNVVALTATAHAAANIAAAVVSCLFISSFR
jgi:hypothetical protein